MIEISNEDIMEQTEKCVTAILKGTGALPESRFIAKAFPVLERRVNRVYPYQVKIPKSIDAMLQGDFEPERILTIEKPFEGPYCHMWFGDATDGVALRCGYKNGDSRYINDVELGDANIHGVMGGATGQGKSVALNSMIYGICYEYAPWEVRLTLSDAKIVEFKSIAVSTPMPHIDTIAATGDVDYLLSVLKTKSKEMNKLQSVFATATKKFGKEVKNIKNFRQVTGLILPQNILVFDEFQTMFKAAEKLAAKVASEIDSFARLGRNAGYHLFLTSQELGNDLPTATLNNITVRAALGCQPQVSEMILGNDAAKGNLGKKGYLIFNLASQNKSKSDNSLIRVPLILSETKEIYNATNEAAEKLHVKKVLNFYDEQSFMYEKAYEEWLHNLPRNSSKIYLGEPSFIMEDELKVVSMNMEHSDSENICILSPSIIHQLRLAKMLMLNVQMHDNVNNLILCLNDKYVSEIHINELNPQHFYTDRAYENCTMMDVARSLIYRRMLCIKADSLVFEETRYTDATDQIFYTLFEKGSDMDTITYRSRFFNIYGLLETDIQFIMAFSLQSLKDEALHNKRVEIAKNCLGLFSVYESEDTKLEMKNVPPIFAWILGIDRFIGIGRDPNSRKQEDFKKLLQDAFLANIRFIVSASTAEELSTLYTAFRWILLDDATTKDLGRIKCEDYPAQKGTGLAVLYDRADAIDPCKKFKKMIMDGELPPL